jgi:hypothetical protein
LFSPQKSFRFWSCRFIGDMICNSHRCRSSPKRRRAQKSLLGTGERPWAVTYTTLPSSRDERLTSLSCGVSGYSRSGEMSWTTGEGLGPSIPPTFSLNDGSRTSPRSRLAS